MCSIPPSGVGMCIMSFSELDVFDGDDDDDDDEVVVDNGKK